MELGKIVNGGHSSPQHKLVMIWHERPEDKWFQRIQDLHPNLEVVFHLGHDVPHDIPKDLIRDATILLTCVHFPDPNAAPSLKLIHIISAGVDQVQQLPIYTHSRIPITNSSGVGGPQIAEWVVATLLAHNHHIPQLLSWQSQHKWATDQELSPVTDLYRQRVGILGYGSIGRHVAHVCNAMGMEVLAFTASPRTTPESKLDRSFHEPGAGDPYGNIPSAWYSGLDRTSLHAFLKQDLDVVVLSLPLSKNTTHLLGAEEFTILGRRNAFICNVARGPILDTSALTAALQKNRAEGGLRGAALDVTDPEPLPRDHALWDLPNVFITPHVSGRSSTYLDRCFKILEANLRRMATGQPLINVVERRAG